MTKEDYIEFCREIPGALIEQPFTNDFSTYVVRRQDNRRWFGVIMVKDSRAFVNLKCDPLEADFLRGVYVGIVPAYHMNKQHWSSVYFHSDVPDELIMDLTRKSFQLTAKKKGRG